MKKGFMDLTCSFLYRLSRGHEYVLNVHNYDNNAILVEPLTGRKGSKVKQGWNVIYSRLKTVRKCLCHVVLSTVEVETRDAISII